MAAKVKGLPELIAKLNMLGERDTLEKISYRATFGVSKDLREAAHANAVGAQLHETGALDRGFAIKRMKEGTLIGYTVGMRAGPKRRRDKQNPDDNPWYWWLQEFGTVHVAPAGFFQKAFRDAQSRAPQQIIRAGTKAVLDSGNRALKRFGNGKAK